MRPAIWTRELASRHFRRLTTARSSSCPRSKPGWKHVTRAGKLDVLAGCELQSLIFAAFASSVLFALSNAVAKESTPEAEEDAEDATSYIVKPTGFVASSLESLLETLKGTPKDSTLKKKALLKLIAASATKPSSAEMLWDLGAIDLLAEDLKDLDVSDKENKDIVDNVTHCLKQIVVQGAQGAATHCWNPRTFTVRQFSTWSALFINVIQKSDSEEAIREVAIIMDQLVENAQDSLSPNPRESVDVTLATKQIVTVLSALVRSGYIHPNVGSVSDNRPPPYEYKDSDVETRVFTLRSLANIASQSEFSALIVAQSDIPKALLTKWLAGCDQRSLVYISRLVSILSELPFEYKKMMVDSGYLGVLSQWARSDNKQIRLATIKSLENLMTEDDISRLIIREYGMDLFVELADKVDIDVQRAAERVIRSFLIDDKSNKKGPSETQDRDPAALRKSRGDWKLDADFNLV